MFLTPPNFTFPLQLVPVFEWEAVDPPPPPAAPCEGSATSPASADGPSDHLRLVFKGYEWRAIGERSCYPREDWESILRSEADAKEDERDPLAHRHDPARRPAPARPAPDVSHDASVEPGTDPSEPT